MKKLIMFFAGLMLLMLTFAALFFAGAIYDAGDKVAVETFFFRPNNLSQRRVDALETPAEMGASSVIDRLVAKFATEYFYAIPDMENIARRTSAGSVLSQISSPDVFEKWQNGEALKIQDLADKKAMRLVRIIGAAHKPTPDSVYWTVNYELRTWRTPNDLTAIPEISRGTMYLDLVYEPGIRESIEKIGIHKYLDDGGDPASLFKFRVNEIAQD